jgi:hypothetical protein
MRNVLLDHDTTEQAVPCAVKCRIGNSFNLTDPNDADDVCAPQWRDLGNKPLKCPENNTNTNLSAQGLKPGQATQWSCYEANRFLMFEFTIQNADGSLAIGGDTCLQRFDFDVHVQEKHVTA